MPRSVTFVILALSSAMVACGARTGLDAPTTGTGTSSGGGGSPSDPCPSDPNGLVDAAWVLNFGPGAAGTCASDANATQAFGDVSSTVIDATVNNGQPAPDDGEIATVCCSVVGAGTFRVSGHASTNGRSLSILIPAITASATEGSAAAGTVIFESAMETGGDTYSGTCAFYFKRQPETVAPGKIWGTFACGSIDTTTGDVCAVSESTFVFENCAE